MAPDALVRREVATEAGVFTLLEREGPGDPARPLVLALPGFFAGDADLTGTSAALGVYADGCVAPLVQARMRGSWSVAAVARGIEAVIAEAFPERAIVLLGASIGATVAVAVRTPNLRRVVAIEPILTTAGLWPIVEPLRRAMRPLPAGDGTRRRWFELFGVAETALETRDYRGVLEDLAAPADVIVGAEPLGAPRALPRFPSFVGEAERRALTAHPRVRLHVAAGAGHNVQNNAGRLATEVLLEACRRAAAEPPYDVRGLDEALFEATPITARQILHWGEEGEAFRAAILARNPQAQVELADEAAGGAPVEAIAAAACPPDATLAALALRLTADGRIVMRWTREAAPEASADWLAAAGFAPAEVLESGIVRLRRAEAAARPLHLETLAFAPLLMDVRARLPARMLRSVPDLTVTYRTDELSLPRLPAGTPKAAILQRPGEVDPQAWIGLLAPLIADDWVVVMEYDDHPAVVADLRGGADAEARLRRMGFVHGVQTTTEPLAEAFAAVNPEVALFPNAVFELLPFPEGDRGRRVFYGAATRGDFAVEVARALGPAVAAFPDAEFVVVGDPAVFDALPTERKVLHDYLGYEAYLAQMARCAVSLSPLEARPFIETKSDAKHLDAARAGVLTIASPPVYERTIAHGVNGYLARRLADWPDLLAQALREPETARTIARRAWEEVRDGRMFAHQAQARRDWYESLWRRRAGLTEALMGRLPGLAEAVAARRGENNR